MADTLTKLFGSAARVRLLRLFLFNPKQAFTLAEAALRAQVAAEATRREVQILLRAGLLERHPRRNTTRYGLASTSPYIEALQNLLLNTPVRVYEMYERLRSVGAVKLIVVSGVFTGQWEATLDLLIVGDRIKERALEKKIKLLEAEMGKEVRFTVLTTAEFFYRLNMSDRLLRDIFDYPHTVVYDRLDIGLK